MINRIRKFIFDSIVSGSEDVVFEAHAPGSSDESLMSEIKAYREELYSTIAPHLISPEMLEAEKRFSLDERSWLFTARCSSSRKLLATLRMTPFPYECSYISEINARRRKGYFEIGRLVARREHRNLGKKLLAYSGAYLCLNCGMKGLVAICRKEKEPFFIRFGMKRAQGPVFISDRGGDYYLLKGSSFALTASFLKNFFFKIFSCQENRKIVSEEEASVSLKY